MLPNTPPHIVELELRNRESDDTVRSLRGVLEEVRRLREVLTLAEGAPFVHESVKAGYRDMIGELTHMLCEVRGAEKEWDRIDARLTSELEAAYEVDLRANPSSPPPSCLHAL